MHRARLVSITPPVLRSPSNCHVYANSLLSTERLLLCRQALISIPMTPEPIPMMTTTTASSPPPQHHTTTKQPQTELLPAHRYNPSVHRTPYTHPAQHHSTKPLRHTECHHHNLYNHHASAHPTHQTNTPNKIFPQHYMHDNSMAAAYTPYQPSPPWRTSSATHRSRGSSAVGTLRRR